MRPGRRTACFENVVGSNFGDHITGDNNANILDGGGGNGGDLTGLAARIRLSSAAAP